MPPRGDTQRGPSLNRGQSSDPASCSSRRSSPPRLMLVEDEQFEMNPGVRVPALRRYPPATRHHPPGPALLEAVSPLQSPISRDAWPAAMMSLSSRPPPHLSPEHKTHSAGGAFLSFP